MGSGGGVLEGRQWLVQDERGQPLPSSEVSFGGWRRGPWYMLDGTHPGAQEYLRHVFAEMRHDWGCRYFKLDALTWGALHGGVRHDRRATRIEAYRRGLAALRRGAGEDMTTLGDGAWRWLRRLVPPLGVAARFGAEGFELGEIELPGRRLLCRFNWSDAPQPGAVSLPGPCRVTDFWSGAALGTHAGTFDPGELAPHSARVFECVPADAPSGG